MKLDRQVLPKLGGIEKNGLQRFWMLFWIEIKRCQAGLVAPVLAIITIALLQREFFNGVVLWSVISKQTAMSHLVVGVIGAGIGAWINGRIARNRVALLVESTPAPASRSHLVVSLAVAFWMLTAYLAIFVRFAYSGLRDATWGGPDLLLVAIGGCAAIAYTLGGCLIGSIWKSPLAAPLASIVMLALPIYFFGGYQHTYGALAPYRFIEAQNPPEYFDVPRGDAFTSLFWSLALAVGFGLIIVLVKKRTIVSTVAMVAVVMLSIGLGSQVAALDVATPMANQRDDFELVCETVGSTELCVHKAYESLLPGFVAEFELVFGPLIGTVALPVRVTQVPFGPDEPENSIQIFWERERDVDQATWEILRIAITGQSENIEAGPGSGSVVRRVGLMSETQCVIWLWLVPDAGPSPCSQGISASPGLSNSRWENGSGDPEVKARIEAKVDTFSALSPEAQQAWLIANWDHLRAGNLTLEDLP